MSGKITLSNTGASRKNPEGVPMSNSALSPSSEILEGIISVKAAIEAGSRQIFNVFVDLDKYKKRNRKITAFVSFLKAHGIKPEFCERGVIDAFVQSSGKDSGSTHGGVAASVGGRIYRDVSDILDKTVSENGFCVYLDGVEDPFNLGYAFRALYASGASGIILPGNERSGGAGVLARSSAGASEYMSCARFSGNESSENRLKLISEIKKRGIKLCCSAVSQSSEAVFSYSGGFPMILFIGGEKRGISPEFMEKADRLIHIPYASPEIRYSLPTATVAAVAGFELFRIKNGVK